MRGVIHVPMLALGLGCLALGQIDSKYNPTIGSLFGIASAEPQPQAPPVLDLGGPITVAEGKSIILTATTTAKKVTWVEPPGTDVSRLDGKRLAVWALPGTYTFRAMIPSGDDVVSREVTLTITEVPRPPPGPGPPVPPGPVVDPLLAPAQAAYDAAPATVTTADGQVHTKAQDKAAMRAVFLVLADAMRDPAIKTAKNLYDVNANSMKGRIDGRLGGVGQVFARDFATVFPAGTREGYVLTPADREAAKLKLLRYSAVLQEVK